MSKLEVKPLNTCKYDLLSLGEIMLRFDPGEGRIRTTREFKVWEGGGEYNVARGLRRCFGLRTAVATAFADNDVGRLLEDFVLQGGVDTSLIRWAPSDGIGRTVRNWTGTDGILEIYAGDKLVKRFMKIDKLTTATGTNAGSSVAETMNPCSVAQVTCEWMRL